MEKEKHEQRRPRRNIITAHERYQISQLLKKIYSNPFTIKWSPPQQSWELEHFGFDEYSIPKGDPVKFLENVYKQKLSEALIQLNDEYKDVLNEDDSYDIVESYLNDELDEQGYPKEGRHLSVLTNRIREENRIQDQKLFDAIKYKHRGIVYNLESKNKHHAIFYNPDRAYPPPPPPAPPIPKPTKAPAPPKPELLKFMRNH
jgi:hypothetical protein